MMLLSHLRPVTLIMLINSALYDLCVNSLSSDSSPRVPSQSYQLFGAAFCVRRDTKLEVDSFENNALYESERMHG
jgi:hypothetical protein